MAVPYNHVSRDEALARTEFSDSFKDALALSEFVPWAAELGHMHTTDALKTVWPIPFDAVGYKELLDDITFDALGSRTMNMTTKRWFGGVEEFADVIEGPNFIGWEDKPQRYASEWLRKPNDVVAGLLAINSYDGPLLGLYADHDTGAASTRRLFAADHPYNVLKPELGDFDNRIQVTVAEIENGTAFDAIDEHFGSILNPDGTKSLGLTLAGGNLLVPYQRRSLFKRVLEFDTLIAAVNNVGRVDQTSNVVAAVTRNNIYKGQFGYTNAIELSSANYFYAIAGNRSGMYPWVVQTKGSPEEIMHDKSSELYKRKLKVGVAYVGTMNAACALPHPIVRVEITG